MSVSTKSDCAGFISSIVVPVAVSNSCVVSAHGRSVNALPSSDNFPELVRAAQDGAPFPGAPTDVTEDERMALWFQTARRNRRGVAGAENWTLKSDLFVAYIVLVPLVTVVVGASAVIRDLILPNSGGIAMLASAFPGGFVAIGVHFIQRRIGRSKGLPPWNALKSKSEIFNVQNFTRVLSSYRVVLSPALARLLDMKEGDEDRILAELGPADLVALKRLVDGIGSLPNGIGFHLAGENRELVSRVLECLWGEAGGELSFDAPQPKAVTL